MAADRKLDLSSMVTIMEQRLADKGIGPAGVYWRDQESMNRRFDQILAVCRHERQKFGFSDLGCGYGALFTRARELSLPVTRYIGYDISGKMLEAARSHVRSPHAEFVQGDRLDRPNDYAFSCGIINMPTPGVSDDQWTSYVEAIVQNLHEHSIRGFAFNSLTTYVDYRQPDLYYGDPLYFFDLCKKQFSRKVSLLHDADNWEWTIYVRK
jgi:SAM-dependent methyltransferase